MTTINRYTNGNAEITLDLDTGTRVISFEDDLKLEYPLNVDIRLGSFCPLGLNPKTGKAYCSFCHEEARTDGDKGDNIWHLRELIMDEIPPSVELAIGINFLSPGVETFLDQVGETHVVNVTINQKLNKIAQKVLWELVEKRRVRGVGVSLRDKSTLQADISSEIRGYSNSVLHTILGIDAVEDVIEATGAGFKKVLLLGEKDFGFNKGKVNLDSPNHKKWKASGVKALAAKVDIVAFDNLAVEQLDLKKIVKPEIWETHYNGEHSLYINAVDMTYSPSSRSPDKVPISSISFKDYFSSRRG